MFHDVMVQAKLSMARTGNLPNLNLCYFYLSKCKVRFNAAGLLIDA